MKLGLFAMMFAAWSSTAGLDRVGERHGDRQGPERPRVERRSDGDRGRGSAPDARRPPGGEGRGATPELRVALVSLRCVDAQEPLGDEVALTVGGRPLHLATGLVTGSVTSLAAFDTLSADGFTVGLAEQDGAWFGYTFDDEMGEDTPTLAGPGLYTTTFRGHGGTYELAYRVEPDADARSGPERRAPDRAGDRPDRMGPPVTGRREGGGGHAPERGDERPHPG